MTMKKRRILIIHESVLFQNIIRRTLTAEVPDVDLHFSSSSRDALQRLDKELFDMVISANEMEYKNGTDIYEIMTESGRHKKTGFLLLTSEMDPHNHQLFKEKGITNILVLPFKAGQLAHAVEAFSQPREWRMHRRLEIPNTQVIIMGDKGAIPGQIVNLSLGGMLNDLQVIFGIPSFSRFYPLEILFPSRYGSQSVKAQGYILRQSALQWFEPPALELIQMAWRLTPASDSDAQILETILNQVSQEMDRQDKENIAGK